MYVDYIQGGPLLARPRFFKTFSLALMSKKILGRRGGGHFGEVAAYTRVEI